MCEILLRIVDRPNADPYKDANGSKAGYVITIQQDGWPWSFEERFQPFWRIIAVPGVPIGDFGQLLRTESAQRILDNPNDPLADPSVNRMLRGRAWGLNVASLPNNVRSALLAPRTGTGILTVSRNNVANVITKLAAIPDPAVIG